VRSDSLCSSVRMRGLGAVELALRIATPSPAVAHEGCRRATAGLGARGIAVVWCWSPDTHSVVAAIRGIHYHLAWQRFRHILHWLSEGIHGYQLNGFLPA